jgi:large subunit ribosomal protein L25
MTERLRANVPITFAGEAPATKGGGVLLRGMDAVEVESLPRDLPHQLEVDLSALEEIDASIHVRDLAAPPGVTILTPGDELVAKVAAPAVEVEEVVAPTPPPAEEAVGRVETTGEETETES